MTDAISGTLSERGARYGVFAHQAVICQDIKDAMRHTDGWHQLAPDQKEALEMMANKVGRMLNGDPHYRDNWHDLVGYFKLVDDRMAHDEQMSAQDCFMFGDTSAY